MTALLNGSRCADAGLKMLKMLAPLALGIVVLVFVPSAVSQVIAASPATAAPAQTADHQADQPSADGSNLPEAPQPRQVASIHAKYIPAGVKAQPIDAHDKVLLGVRDLYGPVNLGGIFLASGYEQLLNGQPNYGTDRGAYGERLGAAAIRDNSQGIFTDAVFAPLLHEDPRYYIEGPGYSLVHRALYAITRPLITRKDNGRRTINGALLLGYASSAALTNAYYPQSNRNVHDTLSTFGGSIGGAALGFFIGEFSSPLLQALHLEKR